MFGREAPLEVEVGSGKGLFLAGASRAHPEHDFVGIEIARKYARFAAARLAKQAATNALVICGDALLLLRQWFPAASLASVHVYFPDPWWKKRHHKRRLWTPDFVEQCGRVLRVGGRLHIATDVGEYYETMRALLDARKDLACESADERTGSVAKGESLTNFELKARVKGGAVWRAQYVKQK